MKRAFIRASGISLLALSLASAYSYAVFANPTGGTVAAGSASISSAGNTLTVNQSSSKAIIDWRGFDIAAGETTDFVQPSSSAITLNRVNSASASYINGTINANGNIVILNANGVLFGKNSVVNVNSLLVTTADIDNAQFMAGSLNFNKPGNPNATIENQGIITAAQAGLVGLVAPNVLNSGIIRAKLGTIDLASGDLVTVDFYGDGLLEVQASPALQSQLVSNTGKLIAKGGTIEMTAAAAAETVNSLVNVGGTLDANAVGTKNGNIYIYAEGSNAVADNIAADKGQKTGTSTVNVTGALTASSKTGTGGTVNVLGDNVTLAGTATVKANGATGGGTINIGGQTHGAGTTPTALTTTIEAGAFISANATQNGNGGTVTVWSDDLTNFGGSIQATGGAQSGNGGSVETSGHALLNYDGTVDLLAANGITGTLLLDPENVTITNNASVTDSCTSGTCAATGDTSYLNVSTLNTALATSNVIVTTGSTGSQTGNIVVSGTADSGGAVAINWSTGNLLTLSAAGNITIDAGASITNTYAGTFANTGTGPTQTAVPVLLALRADNASTVNGSGVSSNSYGVTNNGVINFSTSTGAVSFFDDGGFANGPTSATVLGTAFGVSGTNYISNSSWAAPTNSSVSKQFAGYQLVNGAGDLAAIGNSSTTLGYIYALGTNIVGGGAAFNSNTPLGTFTGTLDGQYGALTGGSDYGVTGFTITSADTNGVGLFEVNRGIIRNLSIGLTVSETYNGTVPPAIGALVGTNNGGTIANVAAVSSGSVSYYNTNSGTNSNSAYVGGLTGSNINAAVIINSTAADTVSYAYQGSSSVIQAVYIGGLVGDNTGGSALSISGSSASGAVNASATGCSGACTVSGFVGGLIGLNGNSTATAIAADSATGNVSSSLSGGHQYIGGLVGQDSSTSTAAIINSSYTTGTLSYTGSSTFDMGGLVGYNQSGTIGGTGSSYSYSTAAVSYTGSDTAYLGGLVGYNSGAINQAYATGNVSSSGTNTGYVGGGLVGSNYGTISNSYAQTGSVSGTSIVTGSAINSFYEGGLIGSNVGTATVTGSTSSENVSYIYQGTSSGTSTAYVGGLVGYNGSTATTSISGSSASGAVNASYSQTGCSGGVCTGSLNGYIGGLIGENGNNTATAIAADFATGNVSSSLSGSNEYIGGLVGLNLATSPITNTYATGAVSFTGSTAGAPKIGGLVGYDSSISAILDSYATGYVSAGVISNGHGGLVGSNVGTITTSYYDANTTGQSDTGKGTSQTTTQLQAALPSGFSSSVWGIVAGSSYPYLLGQLTPGTITALSGTPQIVSGTVYNAYGSSTALAGANVGLLVNGSSDGAYTAGSNGYYYFLLAPSTLSGTGSELLAYLTGTTKGNTFDDGATGSVTGLNIYGNTLKIISSTNTPASIAGGLATAMGSNTGSNFLAIGSTSGANADGGVIDAITASSGNIELSSNVTWSGNNEFLLSAANNLYIDSGVTITNTYASTFTNTGTGTTQTAIPVLLALRADNASANGAATASASSYGVTNNGTINFASSTGAVSIFNDWNFTAVNGTQTANSSWVASDTPTNQSVSSQFTTYQLVNSVADLVAIGSNTTTLGGTYALGTSIVGGGAAFNSNTPLGNSVGYFNGILDGQYGALTGGSDYGITGLTMTVANNSTSHLGLFDTNSGIIRNLTVGLTVSDTYNGTAQQSLGALAAVNNGGTIANVTALASGSISYTNIDSGTSSNNAFLGGLVGTSTGASGVIVNSTAADNVTYTYQGTSTATMTIDDFGGLIGSNGNAISGSSASGTVTASYSQTGCSGGVCTGNAAGYLGGLVGQNNTGFTITNSSASGAVIDSLTGSSQHIGGLIGDNSGTIQGTGSSYSYATGNVSYSGNWSNIYIGGLVGYNQAAGIITQSYTQTGAVTGTTIVAGTASNSIVIGGLVGGNIGTITNATAADTVTYVYQGTSSGTSFALVGGLIGQNASTVTTSISGSSASGAVNASYSQTGCSGGVCTGNVSGYVGGLIGQNGTNTATATSSNSATGNVSSSLSGGNEYIGGLVGYDYSTSASAIINSYYTTGTLSYTGTGNSTNIFEMGGLVGYNQSGTIGGTGSSYSYTTVPVSYTGSDTAYLGGLVGYNLGTVNQAYATGNVSYSGPASANIGGLVGYNGSSGAVSNSYAQTGTVTGTSTVSGTATNALYLAGLVGLNNGTATITGSTSSEAVNYIYQGTSSGTSSVSMGGLVGYNTSTATTSISGSSASGIVTAGYSQTGCSGGVCTGNVTGYVGGLIGQYGNNGATATSSNFATGNVSSSLSGGSEVIGGLVGDNFSTSTAAIINSYYTTGTLSYTGTGNSSSTFYMGGLVGDNISGTIGGTGSSYSYSTAAISYSGSDTAYLGGLVGYNSGAINQAYATGNVSYSGTNTGYVAGLAGNNAGTINQAYATGNVSYSGTNTGYVAGLAGSNSGTISNSYAQTGSVSGTITVTGSATNSFYEGGLIGLNSGTATVTGSTSSENVSYIYQGTSSATATVYIGGLVGFNSSSATTAISGSSASGAVTAGYSQTGCGGSACTGSVNAYIGGLIGSNNTATSANFATGAVTDNLSSANEYVGGLVGGSSGTSSFGIANSYATGSVTYGGATSSSAKIGGLVGNNASGTTIIDTYATGYVSPGVATSYGGLIGSNAGTVTTSYYDANTTGQSDTGKGTSQTTTQLQAALPNGFSSSVWGIVAGSSYPYLLGQLTPGTITALSGTPQVISGIVYGAGNSISGGSGALAGVSVASLVSGATLTGFDTSNGVVTTGANGYYYYLLPSGTLSNMSVLTYLTGTSKGDLFNDSVSASLSGQNIYANTAYINALSATTLSGVTTDLTTAMGANSGSNFLYTISSGALAGTANDLLALTTGSGTFTIDKALSSSGTTGDIALSTTGTIAQSAAITSPYLVLTSVGGTYTLTNASNNVQNLGAYNASGNPTTINFNDGGNNLVINEQYKSAGLIATNFYLTDTGTVTQSHAIVATNLALSGSGATFNLTGSAANAISNLAASIGTGTVDYTDKGSDAIAIGTVNGISGVTAATFELADAGGAVTQTQAITATNMLLGGGTYTLTNAGNSIGTLAGTPTVVSLTDNTALTVGTVGGTAGLTGAGNITLTATGTSGNITTSTAITDTAAGTVALTAGGNITLGSTIYGTSGDAMNLILSAGTYINDPHSINTYGGNVVMRANNTDVANTSSSMAAITIGNITISTSGGYIILGGGSASDGNGNPTGAAISSGESAISLAGAAMNAGGGNISIQGLSSIGGVSAVLIGSATSIATTGSGTITINGTSTGTSAGGNNNGVKFQLAATVSAGSGAITITGVAGTNSNGIYFYPGYTYKLYATSGNITLNGTGNGSGADINLAGTAEDIGTNGSGTTTTGNVTLNALGVGGITLPSTATIAVGGTGYVDLNGGTGAITQTSGDVLTAPNLAASGTSISLNQASGNTIGTAAFSAGGGITVNDTGNLTIGAVNGLTGITDTAAGTAAITTTGNLTVSSAIAGTSGDALNVTLSAGGYISDTANITTYGGNLVMRSNNADVATTSTSYSAINIQNATLATAGGYIILGGGSASDGNGNPTGYAIGSGNRGVFISNATLTAGTGNISIMGQSSNGATASYISGSTLSATGSGSISITSLSTASAGLLLSGDTISTVSNSLILNGTAGSSTGGSGINFQTANSNIYSTSGNVSISGTGGTNGIGINFTSGNTYSIYSTSGTITVNGTGNGSGADIYLTGTAEDIGTNGSGTTTTGNVTLNALGVGGITLPSTATIAVSGTGNIILNAGTGAFINTNGASALTVGTGRWLIYSANSSGDTFDGLNSNNTAIWDATYASTGGTVSQSGDRYIFANQPTVTITTTSDSKTYGATDTTAVAADYSVSGLQAGVANAYAADTSATAFSGTPSVTSTGSATSATVAGGPYAITVAQNLTGVDGYAVAYSSAGVLTVNPAPLTITANSPSMTYGASSLPALSASYSGFVNSESSSNLTTLPTVTTTATAYNGTVAGSGSSVGSYPVTASGAVDSNYTISYVAGSLTVNKANLTITANNQTMTYGGTFPTLTASYSGLVNGDTSASLSTAPTVVSATAATASVGTYTGTITASGAVDSNYTISYAAGNLTIGKATLTITANNQTMTYGGTLPTLTASYSGFVNGDTSASLSTAPTIVSATAATANAGTYTGTITASGAVDSNYTITYAAGNLTIGKAPLTITANNQTMTYGGTFPTLTASYTGLVNGDTASSLTTAPTIVSATAATANAGTYNGTITASGAVDNNYTITYAAGNLTIGKAPLTITADSQTMTYGGTLPTLTASYSGLVNGDTSASLTTAPTIVSATAATANAGTYNGTITASGAVDNNYTITYAAGNLTINKAPLTITADSQTMTYGGTLPTLTASYSGLVNGDTSASLSTAPTVVSATAATANAGTYTGTITASGAVDNNYTISYAAGNLTIGKATLTITANNQTMTYGGTFPTLTASYTGFVNGDTSSSLTTAPTVVSATAATANAGTYAGTLTASGAVDSNYTINYAAGDLTIGKANLTITANSQTMTYGGTFPTLTASYSGFVNGDTSASLSTAPTIVSATAATANAGTYTGTITASGAVDSNYTINYTAGNLTIGKAALTITADNQTMTYGGTLPTLTASYSGLVNGDTSASLTTAPTIVSATAATANAGTYTGTITASGAVDNNYTITYAAGNLTIGKAPLTITADSQTMTYGGTLPTLTASYSGLVNGDTSASLSTAPTVVSATAATANAGTYTGTLTASGAVDSNYTITYAAGNLTINKAPLTITADSQTMTYGGTLPTLTASYSGLVNGDTSASLSTAPTVVSATAATANAGTYTGTLTASGAVDNNYTITYAAGNLTINKANLTITANDASKFAAAADDPAYNGVSYTGLVNGDTSSSLGGTITITRTNSGVNTVGTYAGVLQPSGATSGNYNIAYVNGTFTIVAASQLLVQVANVADTYGATPTYTITSAKYVNSNDTLVTLNGITVSGSTVTISDGSGGTATFTLGVTNPSYSTAGLLKAGGYQLSASNVTITSPDFASLSITGAEQVSALAISPTVSGVSKVYDATTTMNNLALGVSGTLGSDVVTITGNGAYAQANAGTNLAYTISNLSLGGADASDYYLSSGSTYNGSNGIITPKTITLSATKTYDGTTSLTNDVVIGGLVGSQTLTYSGATANNATVSSANNYITALTLADGTSGGLASNYQLPTLNSANAPVTVTPATLTVTADNKSMTYGSSSLPALTDTITGYVNNENATTADVTGNAALSTTATAYNDIAGSASAAGSYTITAAANNLSAPNYVFVYDPGTLTVNKANLTITANSQTMTYGGTLPSLTASYTGLVNGDTSASLTTAPTVVSATAATANAGTYNDTITASGAVDSNYTISYAAGNLTIGKAPLTITANNQTMTYGGTLPSLTVSYSGLVNGDTSGSLSTAPTVVSATAATANAGTYTGTLTASGAVDNNYTISYNAGNLTIHKAPLTIAADNESMTYGGTLPTLTVSYSGLVNGDTSASLSTAPTVVSNTPVTSNAGSYNGTLIASGAADSNYTISYAAGNLIIGKAPLTITANNQTMTYGGTLPTLTASYTGLVNGDTSSSLTTAPTVVSATAATANAGTYNDTITASGAVDNNYTINYAAGNLTIGKAPLTITANSQTMTYGGTLPTLTASYTGLVNGDTSSSLTTVPTVVSATAATANAGTYTGTLTASGAVDSNYTISYAAGNLTIGKAPLTIKANNESMTYGGTLPTLTVSYTGLVNGDTSSSLTTAPTVVSATAATANAGTYTGTLTASGAVDNNYTISYAAGNLTIGKAPLTITANNATMTYGGTLPTLTASYSGFVNGDTSSSLTTAPTVTSATAATANAGTYTGTLTASGAADSNYTISYAAGNLTIGKATLTVVANNQTITYGDSVPTGTITYVGLANADTPSSLTAAPTLASAQSGIVNAGTYADNYTVSGGVSSNYTFVYTDGNLIVQQRPLTVTTYGQTIDVGDALPVLSGSNNLITQDVSLVNWSYAPVGYSGAAGSYLIAASATDPQDRLANYIVTMIDGSLTVLVTNVAPALPSSLIPATVQVNSQMPQTILVPFAASNSQTNSPTSGSIIPTTNNGNGFVYALGSSAGVKTIGGLDLEITPALLQQLGYAPQSN